MKKGSRRVRPRRPKEVLDDAPQLFDLLVGEGAETVPRVSSPSRDARLPDLSESRSGGRPGVFPLEGHEGPEQDPLQPRPLLLRLVRLSVELVGSRGSLRRGHPRACYWLRSTPSISPSRFWSSGSSSSFRSFSGSAPARSSSRMPRAARSISRLAGRCALALASRSRSAFAWRGAMSPGRPRSDDPPAGPWPGRSVRHPAPSSWTAAASSVRVRRGVPLGDPGEQPPAVLLLPF